MKRGRPSELVLFVDPGFWQNPKGRALTPTERDEWLRLLAELLKAGNGGEIPDHAFGVSGKRVQRYLDVGLIDNDEGVFKVHGWDEWNGRDAYRRFLTRERVRRLRKRKRAEL